MADTPDEAAGQSQMHGWSSSYSLSFPSQPPDIRNWFSSYEYESPETPELVADPGGGNGSETQDPLEYRVSGHSVLNQAPQDGCNASRGNSFGCQSGHGVSAIRNFIPIGRRTVEQGAKRKQSLLELFGASFLDDHEEATETESQVVMAVQRNAVEPLSNCDAVGLPDTKGSHEGAVEHSELPADWDGISSVDTQENSPGGQEIEHGRLAVNYGCTRLAGTEEGFLEDGIEHSLADTKQNCSEYHILPPVNCDGIGSAVTEESYGDEISRDKPTLENKKTEEAVEGDGFVAIKSKGKPAAECRTNKTPKPSMGREKARLQENRSTLGQNVLIQESNRSPLADRTNFPEVVGAPAPKITGKWKCPRKGKPYVGPPLKQLRLEQWVRRLN